MADGVNLGIAAAGGLDYEGPTSVPACSFRDRIGASPSGKAADFDSAIPRFESWRPSQYSLISLNLSHASGYAFCGAILVNRVVRTSQTIE
jgi:hypothetical protein